MLPPVVGGIALRPQLSGDDLAVTALGLEHRVAPHIGGHAFERLCAGAKNLGVAVAKAETNSKERRALGEHHHLLRIAVGERRGDMPQYAKAAAEHSQ